MNSSLFSTGVVKLPPQIAAPLLQVRDCLGEIQAEMLLRTVWGIKETCTGNDSEWHRLTVLFLGDLVPKMMKKQGYVRSIKGRWILRTDRFLFWANLILAFVFASMVKRILETGGSVGMMFWALGLSFFLIFVNRKHAVESVKVLLDLCCRRQNV